MAKAHTGRLVVPEVYNIMPPCPPGSSESSHGFVESAPTSIFSEMWNRSLELSPIKTSFALFWNFWEERSRSASLFSRMYWSSLAGKAADRGTAIASQERIDSRVTNGISRVRVKSSGAVRTYIVVSILSQKSNPLSAKGVFLGCPMQSVFE
jgi:hypothetical protein